MLVRLSFYILCMFSFSVSAAVLKAPPEKPAIDKKYVFFMHGSGLFKSYADSAREYWQDKVNAIENKGFIVISEEREKSWDNEMYADQVAEQVDGMLEKGVPAKNITVSGYSRGARISVMVADVLANPKVNFVLLAGCYERDVYGEDIQGRILSIYDIGDKLFGSCIDMTEGRKGIVFKEVELDTGYGHGMGKEVRDEWLEPMLKWIE